MTDQEPASTPTQTRILDAIAFGRECDFADGAEVTFADMDGWGSDRTIDPAWLVDVLSGRTTARLHPRGLILRGARLAGRVDWVGEALKTRLVLRACYLDDETPANLDQLSAIHIELTGCKLAGLSANRANISHDLVLDRSQLAGQLNLSQVTVGGSLKASSTTIVGIVDTPQADRPGNEPAPGEPAVILDRAEVNGDVVFDKEFTATGTVQLNGARIGGGISCCGGSFTNPYGTALSLDGALITRDVFLMKPFNASGSVRLLGATVGGQLNCSGGICANEEGAALTLDGAKVTGSVFLDDEFSATGAVRMPGVRIGGQLVCRDGHFANTNDDDNARALTLDGAEVTGDVILDRKFSAIGAVVLRGARIGGELTCERGTFNNANGCALRGEGMVVAGAFVWADVGPESQGKLDLTRAHVGELRDDRGSWPAQDRLIINGFTYDYLRRDGECDVDDRLEWIRRQPGFSAQPYQQLARIYREAGQETEARKVLITQQRDLRRRGHLPPFAYAWNAFVGATIGHGYRAWRAALILPVLYVISVGLVHVTADHDQFNAVRAQAGQTVSATQCRSDYPCLSSWAYPVDEVVPIINFHQGDYWQPDAHQNWGRALRDWLFVATVLGWAATTLLVVAFTGLAKNK
jgi:hypothetical protein